MSKLISMKTIGSTAVSLSLLLGTLAATPVSTAFARGAVSLPKVAAIREASSSQYRLHLRNNMVFDGAKYKAFFSHAYGIGNRSVSRGD